MDSAKARHSRPRAPSWEKMLGPLLGAGQPARSRCSGRWACCRWSWPDSWAGWGCPPRGSGWPARRRRSPARSGSGPGPGSTWASEWFSSTTTITCRMSGRASLDWPHAAGALTAGWSPPSADRGCARSGDHGRRAAAAARSGAALTVGEATGPGVGRSQGLPDAYAKMTGSLVRPQGSGPAAGTIEVQYAQRWAAIGISLRHSGHSRVVAAAVGALARPVVPRACSAASPPGRRSPRRRPGTRRRR